MRERKLSEKILYYMTVPRCVGCGAKLEIDEFGICKSCDVSYRDSKKFNCSVCAKPYFKCQCVNYYLDCHYVHKLIKLFRYKYENDEKIAANRLIYTIKRANRRDCLAFLAHELANSIKDSGIKYNDCIITNVPRSKKRSREYGIDHGENLAKELARVLGIKYFSALVSKTKNAQKTLSKLDRLKNAKFDYKWRAPDLSGKNILLLDDIVTTGASMGAAATLLHGLGAKRIVGVCVGVAYRDKYKPFAFSGNSVYYTRKRKG